MAEEANTLGGIYRLGLGRMPSNKAQHERRGDTVGIPPPDTLEPVSILCSVKFR